MRNRKLGRRIKKYLTLFLSTWMIANTTLEPLASAALPVGQNQESLLEISADTIESGSTDQTKNTAKLGAPSTAESKDNTETKDTRSNAEPGAPSPGESTENSEAKDNESTEAPGAPSTGESGESTEAPDEPSTGENTENAESTQTPDKPSTGESTENAESTEAPDKPSTNESTESTAETEEPSEARDESEASGETEAPGETESTAETEEPGKSPDESESTAETDETTDETTPPEQSPDLTALGDETTTQESLTATSSTSSDTDFVISGGKLTAYNGTAENVILPQTVTSIDSGVFQGNKTIVTIDLSLTRITTIPESAFEGCTGLKSVVWNTKVATISSRAFSGCSSLETFNSPATVTVINTSAFENCTKLGTVVLSEKLTDIGPAAFRNTGIGRSGGNDTLIIPASVTNIMENAFADCKSLKKVYIGNNKNSKLTLGIQTFSTCETLQEVYLADQVTEMPSYLFKDCPALTKVYIPGTVKTIKDLAITNCPKVTIVGKVSSEAQSYAKEKNIPFEAVNQATALLLMPKTVNFSAPLGDFSKMDIITYKLTRTFIPAVEPSESTVYTSSDENVAMVGQDGTVIAKGFGTATITATCGELSDTATVNVYPVSNEATLIYELSAEIPEDGLECGKSVTVKIYGSDNMAIPIPSEKFEFYTEDESYAQVDKTGKITSTYTEEGNVETIVYAKLKDDPAQRKLEIKIVVTDREAEKVAFSVDSADIDSSACTVDTTNHNSVKTITLDQGENPQGFVFHLNAKCYAMNGSTEEMFTKRMKWSISDTSIAELELNPGGDIVTVTIKPTRVGKFVITATTGEINPVSQQVEVDMRNYAPVLSENKVTLNTKLGTAQVIGIESTYGNDILYGSSYPVTIDNDAFEVSMTATGIGGQISKGTIRVALVENASVKKGTYKANITVATRIRSYQLPITIVVTDAVPSVTIKQKDKMNLFYTDSEGTMQLTCKNAQINTVTLDPANTDLQVVSYDNLTGILTVGYSELFQKDPRTTIDRKLTLNIGFEGSETVITKKITLSTINKKPSLQVSRATTWFYEDGTNSGALGIYDKTNLRWVDQGTTSTAVNSSVITLMPEYAVDVLYEPATRTLQLSDTARNNGYFGKNKKTLTIRLNVQCSNWVSPITVSHKAAFAKEATKPSAADAYVTLKTKTATLNTAASGDYVRITPVVNGLGFVLREDGVKMPDTYVDREKFDIYYENGVISISLKETATEGTYKVPLTYTLVSQLEAGVVIPASTKRSTSYITIKVIRKEPTLTVSASGKLDLIQREKGMKLQLTGISGMNLHVEDIRDLSLTGENTGLFNISEIQTDEKGKSYVELTTAKVRDSQGVLHDVALSTGKTYRIKLKATIVSAADSRIKEVYSKYIKIKPTQSKLVVKSSECTIDTADRQSKGNLVLTITSPQGATFTDDSVTIASNQLADYLVPNLKNAWLTTDGKTMTIPYTIKDKDQLKAGKTHQIKLKITPKGNAVNQKATELVVKVKVK